MVRRGRLQHRLADLACPLGRSGLHIEIRPLIARRWSRPPDPHPHFSNRSSDRRRQGATSQLGTARTLSCHLNLLALGEDGKRLGALRHLQKGNVIDRRCRAWRPIRSLVAEDLSAEVAAPLTRIRAIVAA